MQQSPACPTKPIQFIDTQEALDVFVDNASQASLIAVDTEFLRVSTYYPKLCLMQFATPSECALIDMLASIQADSLKKIFEDAAITKVFHAASQDIQIIHDQFDLYPHNVFDTQIAAAFVGERYQSSYAELVQKYCGISLSKADTLSDWQERPLNKHQLRYAADDVIYLLEVYQVLHAALTQNERLGWALAQVEETLREQCKPVLPQDAWLHVKRIGKMSPKQLAVVREIAAWRENQAMRRNKPRKWILSDDLIVALARRPPRTEQALRRLKEAASFSVGDARSLLEAIKKGKNCPQELYPRFPSDKTKGDCVLEDHAAIIDLMQAIVHIRAKEEHIAPQMLATQDDITKFVYHKSSSRLAQGWRYRIAGQALEALLHGHLALGVDEGSLAIYNTESAKGDTPLLQDMANGVK